MGVRFSIDEKALSELLEGRNGPVVLHQANVGRQVAGKARRLVGVKTSELKASIDSNLKRRATGGFTVEVTADAPHAVFHHEGTAPHIIRPRRARVLVFDAGGTTVFTPVVSHPGTAPNQFLVEAAESLGLEVRGSLG